MFQDDSLKKTHEEGMTNILFLCMKNMLRLEVTIIRN